MMLKKQRPAPTWKRCATPLIAVGASLGTFGTAPQTAHAQAADAYTITNLGTLGGLTSFALDVNNNGQVTGNSQTPVGQANPRLNTFLYTGSGPLQNLGVLPGSNNFSRGYSINDSGQIVGESDNNTSRGFLYTPGVGLSDLGGLPGGNNRSIGFGINNDGVIVGSSFNGFASRGFIRGTNGVMREIGTLDGLTTTFSRAWAISNGGYVTGISSTSGGGPSHAFLFRDTNNNNQTDAGELIDLDANVPNTANMFSEAFGVNDFGQAAGQAGVGTSQFGTTITHPFFWSGGTRTDLGTLGRTFGQALDLNNLGVVVGNVSNISGSPQTAFVWSTTTSIRDLNALIPTNSGWTLRAAEGINERGQIVGYGTFNGNSTAFLLTPAAAAPEPGTLALLLTGFAGVAIVPAAHRRLFAVLGKN